MSDFDDSLDIPPARENEFAWPAGKYQCRLRKLGRARDTKFTKPDDPPRAQFTFTVERVLYSDKPREARDLLRAGEQLLAWCPVNMGPKARFRLWSEALLGRELAQKEQIGHADLIERRAFVTVGPYTTSFGDSFGVTAIQPYVEEEADEDLPPATPPKAKATAAEDDDWMEEPAPAARRAAEPDPAVR